MQTAQVSLKDAGLHIKSLWVQISYLPLRFCKGHTCTGRTYSAIPSQDWFVCVDEMLLMI